MLQSCVLYIDQVKQRSRDAILVLELLTKLNEGVDVRNMMEGNFDFSQFQVHMHTLASSTDSLSSKVLQYTTNRGKPRDNAMNT